MKGDALHTALRAGYGAPYRERSASTSLGPSAPLGCDSMARKI
jgi:hypothetical protein